MPFYWMFVVSSIIFTTIIGAMSRWSVVYIIGADTIILIIVVWISMKRPPEIRYPHTSHDPYCDDDCELS